MKNPKERYKKTRMGLKVILYLLLGFAFTMGIFILLVLGGAFGRIPLA